MTQQGGAVRRNQKYIPKPGKKVTEILAYLHALPDHKATMQAISVACRIEHKNIRPTLEAALGHEWLAFEGMGSMATFELVGDGLKWNPHAIPTLTVVAKKPAVTAAELDRAVKKLSQLAPIKESLKVPEEQIAKAQLEATGKKLEGIDYTEVLADLIHRRDSINAAIAGIEALIGIAA